MKKPSSVSPRTLTKVLVIVLIFRPQNWVVLFAKKIYEGSSIPNKLMLYINYNELKYECVWTLWVRMPTVVKLKDLWFVNVGFFLFISREKCPASAGQ